MSVLGAVASPGAGDAASDTVSTPSADQQGLRLMLDGHGGDAEWSFHLRATRLNLRGLAGGARHASELFRYRELAAEDASASGSDRSTRLRLEVDRAAYVRRLGSVSASFGRQPVDLGSGRFWQPLNVFGAFAPADLDTDFKAGIDAAVVNWYPSAFSSLTAVYAFAPRADASLDDSAALHYRGAVGESSQFALLAARVAGNRSVGASLEGDWRGVGWRVEALRTRLDAGAAAVFWIAGLDYQFDDGTLVSVEWHDNGRGAGTEAGLAPAASDRLFAYRLRQHASRRVLGVAVARDLTPLLRASLTVLAAALDDERGDRSVSRFHQLGFVYSLGNESDLLLAISAGSGKGLDAAGAPRSEFGHLPATVTLRWRRYF